MTVTDFTLRPAVVSDVPLILSLIRELAEFERLLHEVVADEARLKRTTFRTAAGGGNSPRIRCGWHADGFRAVFSRIFRRSSRVRASTWKTYTCVRLSGGGAWGVRLLQRIARLAVERGCGRFEWAVLDWNEDAINFYKKLGAQVMEDWRICRVTGEALQTLGTTTP